MSWFSAVFQTSEITRQEVSRKVKHYCNFMGKNNFLVSIAFNKYTLFFLHSLKRFSRNIHVTSYILSHLILMFRGKTWNEINRMNTSTTMSIHLSPDGLKILGLFCSLK